MSHRSVYVGIVLLLLALAASCDKQAKTAELVIEIPNGFSGEVQIAMGVPGAPPLKTEGQSYVVSLSSDGHFETSTILVEARPRFRDADSGRIWGYTPSISKTGDGIPVRGNIEFFVGTKQQYETQEARKRKSQFPDQENDNIGE